MKDRDRSLDELLKKIYAARVRLRLDNSIQENLYLKWANLIIKAFINVLY